MNERQATFKYPVAEMNACTCLFQSPNFDNCFGIVLPMTPSIDTLLINLLH